MQALRPISLATGTATALQVVTIDTFGYNSGMFNVAVGTTTGTAAAFTVVFQVQECATSGGTYTSVTTGSATLSAINTSAQIRVEGLGTDRQRYLKLLVTAAMVGDKEARVSAEAILGRAFKGPVSNSNTAA